MKLGFWNRLAIVASALTCLIAPTWFMMEQMGRAEKTRQVLYDLCAESARSSLKTADYKKFSEDMAVCNTERFAQARKTPSWREWRDVIGVVALMCALVYALIWLVVATAKWVWRGRSGKNTKTA